MSVSISWRSTFLLAGIWGIITFYYVWRWIPQVPGLPDTGFKEQFRFLKSPAPWLILLATMLGNGGAFSFYSYVNPLLTQVAGFAPEHITILIVLAGFGMVVGNLTSGKLSDRYSPGLVAAFSQGTICLVLLALFFLAGIPWMAILLMCICTTGLFAVSTPQQVLIIRHAPGGQLLGAASIQVAFNLGNAIGAYAGGLLLEAGKGYEYPALVVVPFAFCGFMVLIWFHRKYEKGVRG